MGYKIDNIVRCDVLGCDTEHHYPYSFHAGGKPCIPCLPDGWLEITGYGLVCSSHVVRVKIEVDGVESDIT